jgi:hypothetical protein
MTPHKWGVIERRVTGFSGRKTVYVERVISRHKTGGAARIAAGLRGSGAFTSLRVRRLTEEEKK